MGRTANIRKKKSGGTRIADAQIRPTATVIPRGRMMMNPNANPAQDAANLAQIKRDAANQTGMFGPLKPGTKLPAKPGRGTVFSSPAKPGRGRGERLGAGLFGGRARDLIGGGFRNKAFGMGRAGGDKMRDLAFGMGRDQRGMGMGREQFLEGRGFKSGIEGVERGGIAAAQENTGGRDLSLGRPKGYSDFGRLDPRNYTGGVENMRDILAAKQNQQRGLSKAAATARGAMVGASLGNRTAGKRGTVTSRAADAIAKRGGKTNVKGGTKKVNPRVAAVRASAMVKKMGTTQGGFRLPPKSQTKK
tara:strand:+ start:480 stop:1391 length:912 start_codon:yes stop_codon:yes gene_type:complete